MQEPLPPFRVLDAFAYTGGFAIHIARSIPNADITACDSSAPALALLQENAALNGVSGRITCIEDDVFSLLTRYERERKIFDMIVLDPPAFAKSHTSMNAALRGYKEINLKALKLIAKSGGLLVSCSCSHALNEQRFLRMLTDAACDAGRRLHLIDFRTQPPGHYALLGYHESRYLKAAFCRVL